MILDGDVTALCRQKKRKKSTKQYSTVWKTITRLSAEEHSSIRANYFSERISLATG